MSNFCAQLSLATLNSHAVGNLLRRVDDGVFKKSAYKHLLSSLVRKSSSRKVIKLLRGDGSDSSAVVTSNVVFITENSRHGLVDNVVTKNHDRFNLVALGILCTADKIDSCAKRLLSCLVKDAGLGEQRARRGTTHAYQVVNIKRLFVSGVIAIVKVKASLSAN